MAVAIFIRYAYFHLLLLAAVAANTRARCLSGGIHQVAQSVGSDHGQAAMMRMMVAFHFFARLFLFDALSTLASILLHGVLFLLTVTTAHTFRGGTLGSKGSPWTKVLATLAPLDFETIHLQGYPNGNIACCADTLILTRDNMGRATTSSTTPRGGVIAWALVDVGLLVGANIGCRYTKLSAHNATFLTAWGRTVAISSASPAFCQKIWKVYETVKVRKSNI